MNTSANQTDPNKINPSRLASIGSHLPHLLRADGRTIADKPQRWRDKWGAMNTKITKYVITNR